MNIYENVQALEDEIDQLFDNLKKSIYDITVARRNWLAKLKNWMGVVGKSPVYRQQYPESKKGLSLLQYSEINGLIGHLEGQLNEVGATDLLGHEYVDDILNAYKDKLKNIVRTHVNAMAKAAPTPAPAAAPVVSRPSEPPMPAEEPEDILGWGEEDPKLKQVRRSKSKLGFRPKGERFPTGPLFPMPGEAAAEKIAPKPPAAPKPKKGAPPTEPTLKLRLSNLKTAIELTDSDKKLQDILGNIEQGNLSGSGSKPALDNLLQILGLKGKSKNVSEKNRRIKVEIERRLSGEPAAEPVAAAKETDFPDPDVMDSPAVDAALDAAAKEAEADIGAQDTGEGASSITKNPDPTFEQRVADGIKTHVGELGDSPTRDEVTKLGVIAHTLEMMGAKENLEFFEKPADMKSVIQDFVPEFISGMGEGDEVHYFDIGKRILGYMKSKEESVQNQVDKYKKLLREDYRPELLKRQTAKLSIEEKVSFYRAKLASFRDR